MSHWFRVLIISLLKITVLHGYLAKLSRYFVKQKVLTMMIVQIVDISTKLLTILSTIFNIFVKKILLVIIHMETYGYMMLLMIYWDIP